MKHLNTAFILSWFGNDVREKRKRYHEKQVKWFLEKDIKLVILPQQYKQKDFIRDNNITYLLAPSKLLRPASARNILLTDFYNSNMDYAVIADNDSVLDTFNLGERFIRDFDNNYEYFSDIDFFIPANDYGMPRKDINESENMKDHYVFRRSAVYKGSLAFLRNIKKYYGKEIYYDQYFDNEGGKMIPGEDSDFGLQMIMNGLGAYRCPSIILLEWGGQKNSTWERNVRIDARKACSAYLYKKYGKFGVYPGKNGMDNEYTNFLNRRFMKPWPVEIPINEAKLKQITIRSPSHIKYNTDKWIESEEKA